MYRQGDVLLIEVSGIPTNAQEVKNEEEGRYILARGEATGHQHSVEAGPALMFICPEENVFYLEVAETVELIHQEHATILVDPGLYRVVRQREYTPAEARYVAD